LTIAKLTCRDYGYECDFEVEGDMEHVLDNFGKHTHEEHGIEYSTEALTQFLIRQQN
tara:strand:+ start:7229 stop:7399 length:171 start_codon:yes stop_codon:yes gene_type:complete